MKAKKSKKADVERFRGLFFRIGLAISIIVVIAAFKWTKEHEIIGFKIEDEIKEPIEIDAKIIKIKKEPIKKVVTAIKVVADDKPVDSANTSFLNQDINPDDSIPLIIIPEHKEIYIDSTYEPWALEFKPQFPGGDHEMSIFLRNNIVYPELEREMGIQGPVTLSFVVNKDGSISDIDIMKGVTPNINEEAIRVVGKMPKWNPGRQRDRHVKTYMKLTIRFTLVN